MNHVSPVSNEQNSAPRATPKIIPARVTAQSVSPSQLSPPRTGSAQPSRSTRSLSGNRTTRLLQAGVALTAVGVLVGGVWTGSHQDNSSYLNASYPQAGAPLAGADADYSLANSNYAGSQIAAHEGAQNNPVTSRILLKDQTLGHDVSGHQPPIDWWKASSDGARFTYIKATEGTGFINPQHQAQYDGATIAGIIRGGYHFARPDVSDGASQARYFIEHGGGWNNNGKTLPGALDVEYNPYGDACYGKDPAAMTQWIKDFTQTYLSIVKRSSVIYTSTSWWKKCTGNAGGFGNTNPLWLARYAPEIGELPAGWQKQSIWQFSNAGSLPGDQNYYNGPMGRVEALAKG